MPESIFEIPQREKQVIVTHKPLYLVVCVIIEQVPTFWYTSVKISTNDVRKTNVQTHIEKKQLKCITHTSTAKITVSIADSKMTLITTKGGSTPGRTKQTYLLLRVGNSYTIMSPENHTIMWHFIWDNIPISTTILPSIDYMFDTSVDTSIDYMFDTSVDTSIGSKRKNSLDTTPTLKYHKQESDYDILPKYPQMLINTPTSNTPYTSDLHFLEY